MADSTKEEESNSGDVHNPEEDVPGKEDASEPGGSPKENCVAAESHVAEEKVLSDDNEESPLIPSDGKPRETRIQNLEEARLEEESSISHGKAAEEKELSEESQAEDVRLNAEDETIITMEQVVEETASGIKEESPISETKFVEATGIANVAEETPIAEEIANEVAHISEQSSEKDASIAEQIVIDVTSVAEQTRDKEVDTEKGAATEELGAMEDNNAGQVSIAEEQETEETCISEEKVAEEKHSSEEKCEEKLTDVADKMIADEGVVEEACIAEDEPAKDTKVVEDNPNEDKTTVMSSIEYIDEATAVQKVDTELMGLEEQEVDSENVLEASGFETPKAAVSEASMTPPTAPLTAETEVNTTSEADPTSQTKSPDCAPKGKVSAKVNAYIDKVAATPLPGDMIRDTGRRLSNPSPQARKLSFSPLESPSYVPRSVQSNRLSLPQIDPKLLPPLASKDVQANKPNPEEYKDKIKSIRETFEKKSLSAGGSSLVFGEAFREKQRSETLTGKQKVKEAVSNLRGFDQVLLEQGKSAMGEVDTSSLGKTFVFEGMSEEQHMGSSLVDFQNIEYSGYVFLVHRTRGLLLLKCVTSPDIKRYAIPGGKIEDNEFLKAANQSGSAKIQLQIAAREGAAREVYKSTGIDVMQHLDRLKPAVLQLNPPADSEGKKPLKNEHENRLYYFLQVSEDDFAQNAQDDPSLATPLDEPDSSMKLMLSKEFDSFTFAKEPIDAAEMLKEHGDGKSTHALNMVMNQAVQAPPSTQDYQSTAGNLSESKGNSNIHRADATKASDPSETTPSGMAIASSGVGSIGSGVEAKGELNLGTGGVLSPAQGKDPSTITGYDSNSHKERIATQSSEGVATPIDGPNSTAKHMSNYSEMDAAKDFAKDAEIRRGVVAGGGDKKVSDETVDQDSYFCCCSFM